MLTLRGQVFLKAARPFEGQLLPFVGGTCRFAIALPVDADGVRLPPVPCLELSKVRDALKVFRLQPKDLPTVVVHDTVNELHYVMDADAEFNEEDVAEFLRNVLDGSVLALGGHDEL